ncbi:hypothetical protein ACFV6F_37445 [Kitasatospora phosalacinea]|uniref:hypothetical protein n=1 Tax=Kitasatospora phosalacinea TaxID=2065 RepID=UPI00364601E3
MPSTRQYSGSRGVLDVRPAADLAARHADDGERERTLHPAVAAAVTRAGFARHLVPARWGGTVGSFAELLDAVAELAAACPSAGWWAALQAAHGRLAGLLPERAQRELWAPGPDAPIAAAVAESGGRAVRERGDWRLAGRWRFASGVDHAAWVLLAADAEHPDGPRPTLFLVPADRVRVESRWDGAGLRGSGSHAVAVPGTVVPAWCAVERETVVAGRGDGPAAACHRMPVGLVAALLFAAPALGAARAGLAAWTRRWAAGAADGAGPGGGGAGAREALLRSSAEIEAAGLLLRLAAGRADAYGGPDPDAVALNQRDCTVAVELLVGAVERLHGAASAAGWGDDPGLDRARRDLRAVASHRMLRTAAAAACYADRAAGLRSGSPMKIETFAKE